MGSVNLQWLWAGLCPTKCIVEALSPMVPMNVTLFRNKVFTDIIKLG